MALWHYAGPFEPLWPGRFLIQMGPWVQKGLKITTNGRKYIYFLENEEEDIFQTGHVFLQKRGGSSSVKHLSSGQFIYSD